MVAMVPHQHLRAPGMRKSISEGRLYVNWISTGETLKNVFMDEWMYAGGDSSEERNTIDVPVRITIMAHDDLQQGR